MSIWAVIIILLVIGMMAWPLLLLKPSQAQKVASENRLKLIKQGIKIESNAPKLPEQIIRQYADLLLTVGFAKPIANSLLKERYLAIRNPATQQWFWPSQKRPPAQYLEALLSCYETLPSWCMAVEQGPVCSMIYAREIQLNSEQLPKLLEQLNDCIAKTSFYSDYPL